MSPSHILTTHVFETKFAYSQHALSRIFFGIGTCIVCSNAIIAKVDMSDFKSGFHYGMTAGT
jgi:hypothetical protein